MQLILWGYNMWLVILMETLEEPYGTIQCRAWFPSWHNAEDYIQENRKNLRANPIFKYCIIEKYKVNVPTKLIEHVFPHFVTYHHVFRWNEEKNTFVRDKRLDSKIPNNYWIAFRRQNGNQIEFRGEELQK